MNHSKHVIRPTLLAAAALGAGSADLANATYTFVPMNWTTVNNLNLNTSFGPSGVAGGGIPNFFVGISPAASPNAAYGYGHGFAGIDSYEFGFDPSTIFSFDSGTVFMNFTLSATASIMLNSRTEGIDLVQIDGVALASGVLGGILAAGNHSLSVYYSNSALNDPLDTFQFGYIAIPAPGALAILGVAGLVGARRRR